MKAASAIRKFINSPGHNQEMSYPPADMTEIKDFKSACSDTEWQEFGKQACDALGEVFEAA